MKLCRIPNFVVMRNVNITMKRLSMILGLTFDLGYDYIPCGDEFHVDI